MGTHHPIRKTVVPETPVIPDKLYFRIGDVARLCDLPAYVLRFWETEFPQLKPNKGGTGQRLYRKRDVETALRIKSLLYDQGYTIPGARQVFKTEARDPAAAPEPIAATTGLTLAPSTNPGAQRLDSETWAGQPQPPSGVSTARLTALRDEMRSLLATLAQPIGTPAAAPEAKPKPMRPRLVLEAKPEAKPEPKPEAKPEPKTIVMKPKLQLHQPTLFGAFDPDDTPQAG